MEQLKTAIIGNKTTGLIGFLKQIILKRFEKEFNKKDIEVGEIVFEESDKELIDFIRKKKLSEIEVILLMLTYVPNILPNLLSESVSKYMKVELEQKLKAITSADVNQKLLDENDFEIPEYMQETEVKNITSQYESMQQKIDDTVKNELNLIARKRVKLNLMYMKITEDHKLTVSDKDVSDFISKSDPASQQQIIEKIKSDKNYLNHIKNKALEDVIINHILSVCKIEKVMKKFAEVVN